MSKIPQILDVQAPDDVAMALVSSLPWPAMLIDAEGHVTFQNHLAKAIQESPVDVGRATLASLYPERYRALSGDPPWLTPQNATCVRHDGEEVVFERLWLATIPHYGAYLIVIDESETYRAQQACAQTGRLASIGFMLAGVCHEVSNPLAATYSMVQLLESQPGLTEEMFRAGLAKISANVRRILEVSRTVYEFSRVGEHRPIPIDLPIEEALEMLAGDGRYRGVELVHESDYHAVIDGDRVQLRQVFFNLVLNAAQAMEGSGEIRVTTCRRAHGTVEVEVVDTGPGIPVDVLERIFDPFFTTKASGKGTGLGLSIARDVVREHAGSIQVENRARGGTRFLLSFPMTDGGR